jgi:D-3-phosphoglycerate dehydrogenase
MRLKKEKMTKRPKALCTMDLDLAPEALQILREAVELDYRLVDRETLLRIIGDYEVYWGRVSLRIDREVLSRTKKLKVINTTSTGTDHIDKREALRRGIKILSITRDYGLLKTFTATAECAWMLLLACHRHLRGATHSVLEGHWETENFIGRQLLQRNLGVLGVGRLGRMTVEYGKAFGMRVLGCDIKPFSISGVEQVDFDILLKNSDVISIHIHMTDENFHLFNARTFKKMKEGAILINTSRGDIIDETALLETLESGKLSAFGVDVLHNEWRENISDSPIVQYAGTHDNVIITPHIGGCTYKSIIDA